MSPITTLRWNAPGDWAEAWSDMASPCVASVPAVAAWARVMSEPSSWMKPGTASLSCDRDA